MKCWLPLLAIGLLATLGACTNSVEDVVNSPFRAPLEDGIWTVSAMPRGFDTEISVGLATVQFDNVDGVRSVAVLNACGVSGASEIDWTFDGFTMIESTRGETGGADFVTDSAECSDPDDLLEFLVSDGTDVTVSINEDTTEVIMKHTDYELHLER